MMVDRKMDVTQGCCVSGWAFIWANQMEVIGGGFVFVVRDVTVTASQTRREQGLAWRAKARSRREAIKRQPVGCRRTSVFWLSPHSLPSVQITKSADSRLQVAPWTCHFAQGTVTNLPAYGCRMSGSFVVLRRLVKMPFEGSRVFNVRPDMLDDSF